jgi:hypothetical protein
MKLRAVAIAAVIMMGLAAEARAQVAWDSPLFLPPRPEAGTGIYLVDAHKAGIGVLGTWRGTPQGLGMRLGIADGRGPGGGIAIFGGADVSGLIATVGPELPFDMAWVAGAGVGYDRWLVVSIPGGLSLGRTFTTPEVRFTPYLTPRVALDAHLGRERVDGGSGLEMNFAVDLGVDLVFQPEWTLRVGASLGQRNGVGVGVRF